jgi:hypothetical protein
MAKQIERRPAYLGRLFAFVLVASSICFSLATGSGKKNGGSDDAAGFTGLSLKVQSATVPPGGTFQFQLMVTEPKPIGHGSTRPTVPGSTTGIALHDPIGQTAGAAIFDSAGMRINFTSPLATLGNGNSDVPILTIRTSIPATTPVGQQFPLSIDPASSFWFDGAGQLYPQQVSSGTLTIGGTLAISDVLPGSGFQPAGTRISILGIGFRPDSRVNIEGSTLASGNIRFISGNEIDVFLPSGMQMDGARVRVRNPDQTSIFFAYLHTQAIGQSTHPLLARTYPLFARQTYSSATLHWLRSGSQFTGLAMQNPGAMPATITLETLSATGAVLGSSSVFLPAGTKITRDLLEFFAGAPTESVSVSIKSTAPVQILGLLGDDTTGDVLPIMVTQ